MICIYFYAAIYSVFQHSSGLAGHPAQLLLATASKSQEIGLLFFNVGAQWFAQRAFVTKKAKLLRMETIRLPDLSSSTQTSEEMPVVGAALGVWCL